MLSWSSGGIVVQKNIQKGIYFAFVTAIISGVAIFLNKFAVGVLKDPYIFATTKNIIVGLVLISGLVLIGKWQVIRKLSKKEWIMLILIGIVGGSIPFLLFFKGLSLSTAPTAAFVHKTLFIWVTILAIPFLKEKLTHYQVGALILLFFGNYLLGGLKGWHIGQAELLVFLAVILWSIENIIAKNVLKTVPSEIGAAARMFFGAIIMIIYLGFVGKISPVISLNFVQWSWVIVLSVFLLAYVTFWYKALKNAPVTIVASILVLGSPITTLLNSIFITRHFPVSVVFGFIIIIIGILIFVKFRPRFQPKKILKEVKT